MLAKFSVPLTIRCFALAFFLAGANAAEAPHPLMGATREQVLARMGEPKSQIVLGNRAVYLYPRERVVLRDDVVVEVEQLAADPGRRPQPSEPTGSTPPGGTPSGPGS